MRLEPMTSPLPRVCSANWAMRAWRAVPQTGSINKYWCCGQWRIRTSEVVWQLIYSQSPLATWVTAQDKLLIDHRLLLLRQSRADDENWTRNLPLTRRMLCRLSYVGKSISGQIIPKQFRASSNFGYNELNMEKSNYPLDRGNSLVYY